MNKDSVVDKKKVKEQIENKNTEKEKIEWKKNEKKKNKKKVIEKKKIINWLKTGIFIFFIILLLIVLYSKYIKQEPIIKIFGNAFLIVATGSMEPEIIPGELIIIREQENYKKGDVVTYIDQEGFMITHRIVEKNMDTFISKGDANNIKDEFCDINRIQGKVVFHSKILGFIVLYLLKPICFLYGLSIIVIEILKQEKKGEQENKNEEKQTVQI